MREARLLCVAFVLISFASAEQNVSTTVSTTVVPEEVVKNSTKRPEIKRNNTDVLSDSVAEESLPVRRMVTIPPGRFIVKPADNKVVMKHGSYLYVMNRPPDFNFRFKPPFEYEHDRYFRDMGNYRDRYLQFQRKKRYPPHDTRNHMSDTHHFLDHYGHKSYPNYGSHVGKVYTLTKNVQVPYIVPVEKEILVPFKILIDRPYPVKVIKPYPVPVQKEVPIPFKVPYPQPVAVIKKVPVPVAVPVERPVPVPVPKPVQYIVTKKVRYPVVKHVPVPVKVPFEVPKPYPVYVTIKKNVPLTVEKPYYVPLKYKVDKPYPVNVPKHYPVYIEKPIPVSVEKPFSVPVQVPQTISEPVPYPVEKRIPIYVPVPHDIHRI